MARLSKPGFFLTLHESCDKHGRDCGGASGAIVVMGECVVVGESSGGDGELRGAVEGIFGSVIGNAPRRPGSENRGAQTEIECQIGTQMRRDAGAQRHDHHADARVVREPAAERERNGGGGGIVEIVGEVVEKDGGRCADGEQTFGSENGASDDQSGAFAFGEVRDGARGKECVGEAGRAEGAECGGEIGGCGCERVDDDGADVLFSCARRRNG